MTAGWRGGRREGWHSVRRELAAVAGLVVALTISAWLLLGLATASIIALFCAAACLVALRVLIEPQDRQPTEPEPVYDAPSSSFAGFWRTQTDLSDAIASMSAWDMNARRRMANLLAARLAERHGVSLTAEPEAARHIFAGQDGRAGDLWYWIDPERPTPAQASSMRGIPPRTLAALIHRLEQL